mgnify:CR=1 FL=1
MATTVSVIQTRANQFLRDTSTNSVSAADRLRAISIAVQEIMSDWGFDASNKRFAFDYFDTLNYYDITTDVPRFLEPVDLRKEEEDHIEQFTRKTPREIALEINSPEEPSFAIERRDEKNFLGISLAAKNTAVTLHSCDSLTSDGTWAVDATNSDATNLTLDEVEFKEGTGSLNFDADVSQSANNRATIDNDDMTAVDLSDHINLSSLLAWIWIPESTDFTSVTAYWGSSSTVYWSASVTTDVFGAAWAEGAWNRIKVDWDSATQTGTVDNAAIDFLRFDFNYAAAYADQTDFRLDRILMVRPEKLYLHYNSWTIGETTAGVALSEFAATTDVPFYSGLYDFFDNYVAMRSAAILFRQMGLNDDAMLMDSQAEMEKRRLKKKFPNTTQKMTKSFKVQGLDFSS